MSAGATDGEAQAAAGEVFGHPRGLAVLGLTELWDRISFHGMQAALVLFMVDQLLRPGHVENIVGFAAFRGLLEHLTGPLAPQALASQIFGLYVGLVAATPVLGGLLGDRVLGRTRTVAVGALLMTAGHFCMAFDQSFLLALLLLILGAGCLRGNLSPQVGDLYDKADRRRAVAFQLYGASVNLGAFIAPIVSGFLGQAYGWHASFGFAGVGMLLGLIVYLAGARYLPASPPPSPGSARRALDPAERRTVIGLLLLVPAATLFWIAQSQVWNTYNLWVRDHIDLRIGVFVVPVPWLQALDGLAPFLMLPPLLMLWKWQAGRGREPELFTKMGIGCLIFAVGTAWLAGAGWVTNGAGRSPLLWAVAFHVSSNLGWLYFTPSATALFSRTAPASVNGTMIGVLSLSVTLGSLISGRLGGLYETLAAGPFWLLHAGAAAAGGLIFLGLGRFVGAPRAAFAPALAP